MDASHFGHTQVENALAQDARKTSKMGVPSLMVKTNLLELISNTFYGHRGGDPAGDPLSMQHTSFEHLQLKSERLASTRAPPRLKINGCLALWTHSF